MEWAGRIGWTVQDGMGRMDTMGSIRQEQRTAGASGRKQIALSCSFVFFW